MNNDALLVRGFQDKHELVVWPKSKAKQWNESCYYSNLINLI
jgi:hypothetical protein